MMADDKQSADEQLLKALAERFATGDASLPELPAGYPLPGATVEAIYRELGAAGNYAELPVAFLGSEGTFTHQATLLKFGHAAKMAGHATIADVFAEVETGRARYGVVPVENSTEGAVQDTCDIFPDSNLLITDEILLPIHHHLLANCPQQEIEVIYSHPQVFGQCRQWLQEHLPHCRLVETGNTTAAAERAAAEPKAAAMASEIAAERAGLAILTRNVEDLAGNVTRFYVLGREIPPPTGNDKTSLVLAINDKVGALYEALYPFRDSDINLSLIHSRPSRRRRWDYFFFIDFLGHIDDPGVREVLAEVEKHCTFVRHLGSYPRCTLQE
jgi:chorismate mutase/prephenate dehydratase